MAGQQAQGQPGGVQTQGPITPERVGKIALAAAGVVFVVSVVVSIFNTGLQGGTVEFGDTLLYELNDIPYEAALFGAVIWTVATQGNKDALLKGSAIVYAGDLANNIIRSSTNEAVETNLGTLLGPIHTIVFFLGFVMAIRLYYGKTILPGVGYRL